MFKAYNEIKTAIHSVSKGMQIVQVKGQNSIKLFTNNGSDSAVIQLTDSQIMHVSEGDLLVESSQTSQGHHQIDHLEQLETTKQFAFVEGAFKRYSGNSGPTVQVKPDNTLCRIASTLMHKQLNVASMRFLPQIPLFHVKFHLGDDSFLFNMETRVLHVRLKDDTPQYELCDGIKVTRTETGVPQLMVDLKLLGVSNRLIKLLG